MLYLVLFLVFLAGSLLVSLLLDDGQHNGFVSTALRPFNCLSFLGLFGLKGGSYSGDVSNRDWRWARCHLVLRRLLRVLGMLRLFMFVVRRFRI